MQHHGLGSERRRLVAVAAVVVVHGLFVLVVLESSRLQSPARTGTDKPYVIIFLRNFHERPPVRMTDKSYRHAKRRPPNAEFPSSHANDESAATPVPRIDWAREMAQATQNHIAESNKSSSYRDFSGPSAKPRDWIERRHKESVETNPPWSDRHPRVDADDVLWISDHCAIVALMPLCVIELGRNKARGDLFKEMRPYLDRRVTDPLP